jgi:hypothetical protein
VKISEDLKQELTASENIRKNKKWKNQEI